MSEQKRHETGPMVFGNDWPGIFIRGDEALGIADHLEGFDFLSEKLQKIVLHDLVVMLRACEADQKTRKLLR